MSKDIISKIENKCGKGEDESLQIAGGNVGHAAT